VISALTFRCLIDKKQNESKQGRINLFSLWKASLKRIE